MPRTLRYARFLATLALGMAGCDRTHQTTKDVDSAAEKTTKKVEKGAKSTGEALRPAASAVAGGFKKGVDGGKKGGDAVGKAVTGK